MVRADAPMFNPTPRNQVIKCTFPIAPNVRNENRGAPVTGIDLQPEESSGGGGRLVRNYVSLHPFCQVVEAYNYVLLVPGLWVPVMSIPTVWKALCTAIGVYFTALLVEAARY